MPYLRSSLVKEEENQDVDNIFSNILETHTSFFDIWEGRKWGLSKNVDYANIIDSTSVIFNTFTESSEVFFQNYDDKPKIALIEYFKTLPDTRMQGKIFHKLLDIVIISICSILTGGKGWTDMELFGQEKKEWLSTFLDLPNGIPSHDTFRTVFMVLDAQKFENCFIGWTSAISGKIKGVVPIDGKKVRRSHDKSNGKSAIHMVSAWSSENKLVLGQTKIDEKSNEITFKLFIYWDCTLRM